MRRRVLVIGLDCVPPPLAFERYRDIMPNVATLMQRGAWGPLRSCIPPITVPAWTCMFSGRDPGELGLYGFRNRKPGTYEMEIASNKDVLVSRVWDWASEQGRRVAVLFVPLTWPPTEVNGCMASCLLTPHSDSSWTLPLELKAELEEQFGPYLMDIEDFRNAPPNDIAELIHKMTQQHFNMARHVWLSQNPDLLIMVDIGPDRFHHVFGDQIWGEPRASNDQIARTYYKLLDDEIGEWLRVVDDETAIVIASDHGARKLEGGICINQWLIERGWLVLKEVVDKATRWNDVHVDWKHTKAWSEGGYYARVFLNVRGREPDGIIDPRDYAEERQRLRVDLEQMKDERGHLLGNVVEYPETVFRQTHGVPPDLMVFFADLRRRSLGSVGTHIYAPNNDQGRDGCNHDWEGIFIMAGNHVPRLGRLENLKIYDVARTLAGLLHVKCPAQILGRDLRLPDPGRVGHTD